jgi:hypothetical protein
LLNKIAWIRLSVPFYTDILKLEQLNTVLSCSVILNAVHVTVFVISIPFESMFCFSTKPPFQAYFVAPAAASPDASGRLPGTLLRGAGPRLGVGHVGSVCADDS